jgi:hypothetical protein
MVCRKAEYWVALMVDWMEMTGADMMVVSKVGWMVAGMVGLTAMMKAARMVAQRAS